MGDRELPDFRRGVPRPTPRPQRGHHFQLPGQSGSGLPQGVDTLPDFNAGGLPGRGGPRGPGGEFRKPGCPPGWQNMPGYEHCWTDEPLPAPCPPPHLMPNPVPSFLEHCTTEFDVDVESTPCVGPHCGGSKTNCPNPFWPDDPACIGIPPKVNPCAHDKQSLILLSLAETYRDLVVEWMNSVTIAPGSTGLLWSWSQAQYRLSLGEAIGAAIQATLDLEKCAPPPQLCAYLVEVRTLAIQVYKAVHNDYMKKLSEASQGRPTSGELFVYSTLDGWLNKFATQAVKLVKFAACGV